MSFTENEVAKMAAAMQAHVSGDISLKHGNRLTSRDWTELARVGLQALEAPYKAPSVGSTRCMIHTQCKES